MQSKRGLEASVKLSGLKRFTLEGLPRGPLRDDILSQPDEVSAEEFLASARVWLRLARAG
jgi:hypothetical protein